MSKRPQNVKNLAAIMENDHVSENAGDDDDVYTTAGEVLVAPSSRLLLSLITIFISVILSF